MLSFIEVMDRIKDILSSEMGDKKVYDKDVAKILGLSKEHFSVLKKRGKIPLKEVANFCAKRDISINWILFDQNPKSLCNSTEKYAYVKYFKDINASAGGGAINYDSEEEKLYLDENIIKILGKENIKNIEALNVIGDSMEPMLKDGSIVFIDRTQKDIKKGGVFVISTNGGVFIKRVVLKTDGSVELISENPLYPKENINIDEIIILGKVVGSVEKL
ncbi:S24 family peptidase [Nitrosophilus kaiyonis]|uniref:S24 family peptidase n=1 Tax=Nitrosophilus kaiyonis TaxID=2930200 RepID=UPI00248F6DF5|nr:S24 family peptidase [Nitrosophilus kaiyonis]